MKSGIIAIVGRPNAGKSTLLNRLVGEKVSIVSPKPQTTRGNVVGVMTDGEYQAVFIDTPGIHRPENGLGRYMMKSVAAASREVNGILLVIDASKGLPVRDLGLVEEYLASGTPLIVALAKIDLIPPQALLPMLARLNEYREIFAVVPVSARRGRNVVELKEEIKKLLTDEAQYYPEDVVTDRTPPDMAAEIVRECVLYRYDEEIPHGVGVAVNKFEYREDKDLYEIDVDIICEKPNHKAILIGKGGQALKETMVKAREKLERYLGSKVFLTPWVRVKEDWRNRENLLRELGYDKKDVES